MKSYIHELVKSIIIKRFTFGTIATMIATILILVFIILTAAWNGLVIKWHQTQSLKISRAWHAIGFIIRALLVVLVYIQSCLWLAVIAAFVAWIPYNIIINLIIGQKWWYVGNTSVIDRLIRRVLKIRVWNEKDI